MFPQDRTPQGEIERAGGAIVRRRFPFNGVEKAPGDILTVEEVDSIPIQNLHSLINTGLLKLVYTGGGQRFAVHIGKGQYHVVEGTQITAEPISREDAEAMVAKGKLQ
jgi:hypothetical protein